MLVDARPRSTQVDYGRPAVVMIDSWSIMVDRGRPMLDHGRPLSTTRGRSLLDNGRPLVDHGRPWSTHARRWPTMVDHAPCSTTVDQARPWSTMVGNGLTMVDHRSAIVERGRIVSTTSVNVSITTNFPMTLTPSDMIMTEPSRISWVIVDTLKH